MKIMGCLDSISGTSKLMLSCSSKSVIHVHQSTTLPTNTRYKDTASKGKQLLRMQPQCSSNKDANELEIQRTLSTIPSTLLYSDLKA